MPTNTTTCAHPNCGMPRSDHNSTDDWDDHQADARALRNNRVLEIKGTITLADGTISAFRIGTDFGWQQWGADQTRLDRSVDVMDALVAGLRDENVAVVSDGDDDDMDEDEENA